jgi:hypothetical protein
MFTASWAHIQTLRKTKEKEYRPIGIKENG